ncbi:hypothetical protein H4582DRAFT_2063463 [Lactarius indigo]|nr:hypothetical protein H4582DRAFT_2063463 [Lactarius indigo]
MYAPGPHQFSLFVCQYLTTDSLPLVTTPGFTATTTREDSTHYGHLRSTEVPQLWPTETDLINALGKLRLRDQLDIVRSTITSSFNFLHASIVLENAFPETVQIARFIWDTLGTASLHVKGAEDVHARILRDNTYCWKMSALKNCLKTECSPECASASSVQKSNAHDPIAIVDLIKKLDADFNYIFPRRSKTNNDAHVGSPDLRRPYCSSVIISEVPKAMLVLVSTAYYAALHEWSTGEWKQHDFTTNTFVEAYDCHIVSLNWIESECKTSYHKMMAEIYQLAANGGSRTDPSPPSNSVLNLSMLED